MALCLIVVLASSGALTLALAHSHEHSGLHNTHALDDGYQLSQGDLDGGEADVPENSQAGFHFHSPEPTNIAAVQSPAVILSDATWPNSSGLTPLHKVGPPFQPPRTHL